MTIDITIDGVSYEFFPKIPIGGNMFYSVDSWEYRNEYRIVKDIVAFYDIEIAENGEPILQYMGLHTRNRIKDSDVFTSNQELWECYNKRYPHKIYKE